MIAPELGNEPAQQARLVHRAERRPRASLVGDEPHEGASDAARRAEAPIHQTQAPADVELELLAEVETLLLRDGEGLEQAPSAAQRRRLRA